MFPLDKHYVKINRSETEFLSRYDSSTEIPVGNHPGAFGVQRKNHIHEGVDLYCEDGDEVCAMFDGQVVYIGHFTGTKAGSPWWNDTQCIMIAHLGKRFCLNYGEIAVDASLRVGDVVQQGQSLGHVVTVLRVDKGRPMSMLHLEQYTTVTKRPIPEWRIGDSRPGCLLDPTPMLLTYLR